MQLKGNRENDVLDAWRIIAIEGTENSGSKVIACVEKIEKKDLYFESAMALEVLEEFIAYAVQWEQDRNRN